MFECIYMENNYMGAEYITALVGLNANQTTANSLRRNLLSG